MYKMSHDLIIDVNSPYKIPERGNRMSQIMKKVKLAANKIREGQMKPRFRKSSKNSTIDVCVTL